MRPLTFDPEEFGDELTRALRAINPVFAEAVLARMRGEHVAGVLANTMASRVMRGRRQLRRVLAGERVRWRALSYCRRHGPDAPYRIAERPSGRRRICVACDKDAAPASCWRCGGSRLVLRTHNITGRTWLSCAPCESQRMAQWRATNRERAREAYHRQGARRRERARRTS